MAGYEINKKNSREHSQHISEMPNKSFNQQKKVFIVHGHDLENAHRLKLFLYDIGVKPIVLQDIISDGSPTIIEKFEKYSDCDYAFVIMTPDDVFTEKKLINENGNGKEVTKVTKRARQNVIFEYGYFVARLTRNKVSVIYKEDVDIPSDIKGVEYIPIKQKIDEKKHDIREKIRLAGLIS